MLRVTRKCASCVVMLASFSAKADARGALGNGLRFTARVERIFSVITFRCAGPVTYGTMPKTG